MFVYSSIYIILIRRDYANCEHFEDVVTPPNQDERNCGHYETAELAYLLQLGEKDVCQEYRNIWFGLS